MSTERVPPGPWRWEKVTPDTASWAGPATQTPGEALVASDGTWLLSVDSGDGVPDVHPAVKDLLARAWLLRPPVEPGRFAFDCDLNMEDDDGNNWTLLSKSAWRPTIVYPGAILWVGRAGGAAEVEIVRTELFLTSTRGVMILVTFRQTAIRSLEEALGAD